MPFAGKQCTTAVLRGDRTGKCQATAITVTIRLMAARLHTSCSVPAATKAEAVKGKHVKRPVTEASGQYPIHSPDAAPSIWTGFPQGSVVGERDGGIPFYNICKRRDSPGPWNRSKQRRATGSSAAGTDLRRSRLGTRCISERKNTCLGICESSQPRRGGVTLWTATRGGDHGGKDHLQQWHHHAVSPPRAASWDRRDFQQTSTGRAWQGARDGRNEPLTGTAEGPHSNRETEANNITIHPRPAVPGGV